MLHARVGFDAVKLGDGSVLVVGDDYACYPGGAVTGSELAEIYDPPHDRWVAAESLNKPRKTPATVGLGDGSAFVIGGTNANDIAFSSTKIMTPEKRTWVDGPLLSVAQGGPVAAVLGDGRVLVASTASRDETSVQTRTEIYDPESRKWFKGPMLDGPSIDSLLSLGDGRVLATGGAFEILVALEVFDPASETWTSIDEPFAADEERLAFVALANGDILAIATKSVRRYDHVGNHWFDVAPLRTPREGATLVRLRDGRVLVAGGATGSDASRKAVMTAEIFDPDSNSWSTTAKLLDAREDGQAIVLDDDSVLLFGGDASFIFPGDTPWCPTPLASVNRLVLPPKQ